MVNLFSGLSYLLPPLVVLFSCLILAVVALYKTPRSNANWLFCALVLSMGLWGLLTFGMRSSIDVHRALPWEKALVVSAVMVFVIYYHFTLVFTHTKVNRGVLLSLYSFIVVFAVLSLTDLVTKGMTLEYYGYAPIIGPVGYFLFIIGPALIVAGAYNLFKAYKVSHSYEEKNRLIYLIIAAVFPVLGGGLDAFSNLPPMAIWGNLLFCILTAVAILRYHLLDINVVIRKGVAYLMMSALIAVPYVAIIIAVSRVLGTQFPIWGYTLLIIVLAFILQPLWQRVQERVDRLFYRQRYDYLKALEQFGHQIKSITESESLASSIVEMISNAMQVRTVCLMMLLPQTGDYKVVASRGLKDIPTQYKLSKDSPFVQWIERRGDFLERRDMDIIPQLQALSVREQEFMQLLEWELVMPLRVRDKLVGILVLGQKLSQQIFTTDDLRLLSAVSTQIATSLENARLYNVEREQRIQLEKLDEMRSEFLLAVSHELKTPLTSIKGASELILDETLNPDDPQGKLISIIKRNTERMERRIQELLDFVKMRSSTLSLQRKAEDINRTVEEVTAINAPTLWLRKQTLKTKLLDSTTMVMLDRYRFDEIMTNLLSNASKYSPQGSEIDVRMRVADSQIIIDVCDRGPGVPPEERKLIFEPYHRARKDTSGGLGIGLSIAKSLVELHGGQIWVSGRDGGGSVFSFSLPMERERVKVK